MGLFNIFSSKRNFGKAKVVLCESYSDVGNDVLFRLVDDADNVIRIKQEYNLTKQKDWDIADEEWNLQVAGVSHRIESVMRFIAGESRKVRLAPEPMPKYPHAIAVYGEWLDKRGRRFKEQLGYVPDEEARDINKRISKAKDYLLAGKLAKMFIPTREKSTPGLRIDVAIFSPALPRFEVHGFSLDSGRKRKRTYIAKDKEQAISMAQKDGIVVDMNNIIKL